MDLNGKVCLVTGGAKRLGREIALTLARAGGKIALHYHRSHKEARKTQADIFALGAACTLFEADLSQPDEVKALADKVFKEFGACDVLVNSAAVFNRVPLAKATVRDFDLPYEVNLRAPALLTQAMGLRNFKRKLPARIINLSDVGGQLAWPSYLPYSLSKAGLNQLTRTAAKALAPWVLVNSVAPGPVLPPEGSTPAQRKKSAKRTLLKKVGDPREVARAVRFLAESDFITGAILPVDGGRTLAG
jgi:pteridine reductase